MKKEILFILCAPALISNAQVGESINVPNLNGELAVYDIEADNEVLYMAYGLAEEEKQLHVVKWENENWVEIGPVPANTKIGGVLELKISNGTPFVFFDSYDGFTVINYKNSEWHKIGKPNFASNKEEYNVFDPQFIMVENQPTIIYENRITRRIDMHMLERTGNLNVWTAPDALGSIPEGAKNPFIAAGSSNELYLAWLDKSGNKISVGKLDASGENMAEMSKGLPTKDVISCVGLKFLNHSLYLAYEKRNAASSLVLLKFNNGSNKWEEINLGLDFKTYNHLFNTNLSVVMTNSDDAIKVFKEKQNNFELISTDITAKEYNSCSDKDIIYISFINASGKFNIIKM